MSTRKADKNKGGRPGSYDEPKQPVSLTLTKTAAQNLDQLATDRKLSRSEFVERIGRGLIELADPYPQDIETFTLSEWEVDRLGDILRLQRELLADELMSRGVFEGKTPSPERLEDVVFLIEHVQRLEDKINPPSRQLYRSHRPDHPVADLQPLISTLEVLANKLSDDDVTNLDVFNARFVQKLRWQSNTFIRATFGAIQSEIQAVLQLIDWVHCHEQIRRAINQLPQETAHLAKRAIFYVMSNVDTTALVELEGRETQLPFANLILWLGSDTRSETSTEINSTTQNIAQSAVQGHKGADTS